jgi:hypothetical protein
MATMLMKSAIALTKYDEGKKSKEKGIDKPITQCRMIEEQANACWLCRAE